MSMRYRYVICQILIGYLYCLSVETKSNDSVPVDKMFKIFFFPKTKFGFILLKIF